MNSKKLNFLLLALNFSIVFGITFLFYKDFLKSTIVGGASGIITLTITLYLQQKFDANIKKIRKSTDSLVNFQLQIENLVNQEKKLNQSIEDKTKIDNIIEQTYYSKLAQIDELKKLIDNLSSDKNQIQADNLSSILELETVRAEIEKLEYQKQELIQIIQNKIEQKLNIEQEFSLILSKLTKVDRSDNLRIKADSLAKEDYQYSQKFLTIEKKFWALYLAHIEIFKKQNPKKEWGNFWRRLQRGTSIIQDDNDLLSYVTFYGGHHYYKLLYLFDRLFTNFVLDRRNIDIIDYGCGQALGTSCFFDYLQSHSHHSFIVQNVVLIEPSSLAINRGILHVNHLLPESQNPKLIVINKTLEKLTIDDFSFLVSDIKIHIFSNILDILDSHSIEPLCKKIPINKSDLNIFICVSPRDQNSNIQSFFDYWHNREYNIQEILLSQERLFGTIWKSLNDNFQNENISRVQKLFYLQR